MLSGCNGLVNLAWYHPAIVVFVGHWMIMVLLFVQLLVGLISKHYPPKNQNVTSKGTVSKGKLSCNQHFSGDILVLRGSRNHLLTTFGKQNCCSKLLYCMKTSWWIAKKSIYSISYSPPRIPALNIYRHGGFSSQVFFWFLTSWRLFQPGSKIWVKWIIISR